MSIEQHRRRLFIEGLRAVATFYEQNLITTACTSP